ncbi:PREDICTED: uncharacterized protein LOC105556411 [Vollenhovia emeryi]|uniref:uncharacterized protein LOC105556411 n=1 Tax=Vollenhovia emeryi TaxID=411798 RepID=UPI0005F523F3|nr:PREDICTED: uncharacterized protein LOC105556411 [Vollenhovia emeryi]
MNHYVPLDMSSKKQCNAFSNRRYMPYVPRSSYTPSVPQDETASSKKLCGDVSDEPHNPPRIMCRRLPLTSAAFKYIDIGIRVVPRASYVEIILGDNQGHRMELDQFWKE